MRPLRLLGVVVLALAVAGAVALLARGEEEPARAKAPRDQRFLSRPDSRRRS